MMTAAQKLTALRKALKAAQVDGFLLPVGDEFLSEYPPASAQRVAWLTGFEGSAGTAVVLADKAALFTDGRYTLQAAQQVDGALYEIHNMMELSAARWAAQQLALSQEEARSGDRAGREQARTPRHSMSQQAKAETKKLAYDPWLFSARQQATMETAAEEYGVELVALAANPVDPLWVGRPAAPVGPVLAYPERYAGEASLAKRARVCEAVREEGADALLVTATDSVAWLLNIRGTDTPNTPLVLATALLECDEKAPEGRVTLFVEPERVPENVKEHIGAGVEIVAPAGMQAWLVKKLANREVLLDSQHAPSVFAHWLEEEGQDPIYAEDPCQRLKAAKNKVESSWARKAHQEDGAALVRLLAWLDKEVTGGKLDELSVTAQLLAFRREAKGFQSPSFDTIAGFGPHGAIVHYRATEETNRKLKGQGLFLLDSGGQYLGATTDVTRTVAVGKPTVEQKEAFTRVLKGHIALAAVVFPQGTSGAQLDVLARAALWEAGLDYDHGTGHGVGSYLGVHEGPQRISKMPNQVALKPGMIISNEPGYYKTGKYGIRIENLVQVVKKPEISKSKVFLGFETLTLAPIDRRLIVGKMLNDKERCWLNEYHARVFRALFSLLPVADQRWLAKATQPV